MKTNNLNTRQLWYQANKERLKENAKEYYEANKEKAKEYYETNKEQLKEKAKEYHKKTYSERYNKNKKVINERTKQYQEKNKERLKEYNKQYKFNKLQTDPIYKLKSNIRSLVRIAIKNKGYKKLTKTEIILGCTFDKFKQHIETLFSHPNNLDQNGNIWMNWENYGNPKDGKYELNKTWDYDHINPMKEGLTEMEVIKLNHYTNIQPLCSYVNRFIKKDNPTY